MYLKSLKIVGFKTFPEKTHLEFHPGVTAIVGPNGCGKSNVLEAFRWVIGEQSPKAVRCENMTDVIFHGTTQRKQLNMAEVSVTFADCEALLGTEYHEITFTRRIHRDGQGEYEINRAPCRLKDIQHLLMDTGLGRTAYSIMEQGRITKVLSARPEDRREVFEEAAGITKYKSQRKEALRKLDDTEANLLRLTDIIKEVKRQIGSLQRQAGKARRYKEFYEELRTLEINLARHQYSSLHAHITEMESAVAQITARHQSLALELEQNEARLRELRERSSQWDAQIESLRQARSQAEVSRERANGRITTHEALIAATTQSDEAAHMEIAASEERLRVQEEQATLLEQQIASAREELVAKQSLQNELGVQLKDASKEAAAKRGELQARQSDMAGVLSRLQRLQQELAGRDSEKRSCAVRTESALQDSQSQQRALEDSLRQKTESDAKCQSLSEHLAEARKKLDLLIQHQQESAREREAARTEHEKAERRRVELLARRRVIDQLVQSHEGFSSGVNLVLKAVADGQMGGLEIRETLADRIQITDGCHRAIDALVGEKLQALIVADTATALQIMAFLSGKETDTLCLAPLHSPRPSGDLSDRPESAFNFVSADAALAPLLHSLLGDSYITETLEDAFRLKENMPAALVATRNGECISREGFVFSGGKGKTSQFFEHKQALKEIDSTHDTLSAEIARLQENRSRAELACADLQKEVEAARSQITAATENLNLADRERHLLARQTEDIRKRIATLENELARLAEMDRMADGRHAAQIEERTRFEARKVEVENALSEIENALPLLNEKEADLSRRMTEIRVATASLDERCNGLGAQRSPILLRQKELKETISTKASEMVSNAQKRAQCQTETEQLRLEIEERTAEMSRIDADLSEKQVQRDALRTEMTSSEETLRIQRNLQSEIQSECGHYEIELTKCRMETQSLCERMTRSYQIGAAELLLADAPQAHDAQPEPTPDWDQITLRIEDLRVKLDGMGPVNMDAITEYDELDERHRFLEAQINDLQNSKQNLLETIQRINQTSQELFSSTFEQIRVYFQSTFTELFGGGHANLILADESDPLESGIEIVAKPPGKQPRIISLLSGGEQTMTAMALLFAIYMVKPSPFCILDEMDAPLDESNIGRFIAILQRFVAQSQFLLITHNKKTIGIADALYGVTAEESGVSKVVSVRFNHSKEKTLSQQPPVVAPTEAELPLKPEAASTTETPTPDTQENSVTTAET